MIQIHLSYAFSYIYMRLYIKLHSPQQWNLQHTTTRCNTLQHTEAHCNTLQHTATHCITLQHTATYCILQHTATHCNTLQHTATHCNALQHYSICPNSWAHQGKSRFNFISIIQTENQKLRKEIENEGELKESYFQVCAAMCCSVLQCVVACCSAL